MMSPFARRGLVAALLFTATVSACKCGGQTQTAGCASDDECVAANHSDRWFCNKKVDPPQCEEAARACDTAADCCPSQVCNTNGHFCADKFTPCTGAGSCTVAGQVCKQIGVRPSGLGCTFEKTGNAGACADGTVAFNGYCVGEPPCNGGCTPSGGSPRVCVTATNYCSPAPTNESTCNQTCPTGKMLVLNRPDNIFDTCEMHPQPCECLSLPPLVVRDVARHTGMAASGSNLYLTVYDGQYGDLVLHTYDKNNLSKPSKSEWLDGVPATGTIGGDVTGPRKGITNPGPNVGQYTSIAAGANGDLYVSYYDVDNGDLKFIARYGGPSAAWTAPVTIDGTSAASSTMTGDVGLFSSIALTSTGVPAIAYFRRGSANGQNEAGPSTALLYAVASKAQPGARSDWTVIEVEKADRPAVPCGGACASDRVCVADAATPTGDRCAKPAPTCAPACSGKNTCVKGTDAAETPLCAESRQAAALPDVPQGVGLMASLGFLDDKAVIAYYDSINGQLKAVAATATGAAPAFGAPVILDGGTVGTSKRDVGRWPSLAIGPAGAPAGRIAITFQDATTQQLLLYTSNSLTARPNHAGDGQAGLIHVVDNGLPAAGEAWHPQSFPGVQSAVGYTPAGKLAVAYQDGTPVDLRFATFDPSTNKVAGKATVRSEGASGFYPRLVLDQGTAYLASATIKAATAQLPANQLYVESRPAP